MSHPAGELSCHSVSLSSFQPLHFLSGASVTRVIVSSDLERTTGNGMQHFSNITLMYSDGYLYNQTQIQHLHISTINYSSGMNASQRSIQLIISLHS